MGQSPCTVPIRGKLAIQSLGTRACTDAVRLMSELHTTRTELREDVSCLGYPWQLQLDFWPCLGDWD